MINLMQQTSTQVMYIYVQNGPKNITVIENTDVVVPCIANTTLIPSWIIDGATYDNSIGLPSYFFINATALRIPRIALFLNNTVVQCFIVQIVPNLGLVTTSSDVGVITVIEGK